MHLVAADDESRVTICKEVHLHNNLHVIALSDSVRLEVAVPN
jgi:hypothetical protein